MPDKTFDHHHLREGSRDAEPAPLPELELVVGQDGEPTVSIDPETGVTTVEQPDGSVVIYPQGMPKEPGEGSGDHGANLAEHLEPTVLFRIADDILQGIETDEQSRQEWINQRAKGIELLALKIDEPRTSVDGGAMSVVRSTVMLEAVLRFQANARAELLPSAGPVKVRNDTQPKTEAQKSLERGAAAQGAPAQPDESDTYAIALEREMNAYLTTTAKEYYPDTNRMLFYTGFGGSGFKKVFRCPLRRRPVSEAIDAVDLIVSNDAVDLHSAGRVTHRTKMRQSVLKRMQLVEAYRDVDLAAPSAPIPDPVEQKESESSGLAAAAAGKLPSDEPHTIYECYCELNIEGFEHKGDDGEPSGLPLPYKVTIEKDSRQVLEIRRNWKDGDERFIARIPIVKYPFVEALGFYGIGLLHILGNPTMALTGATRMMLDAGMYASFPGFLFSEGIGRQRTSNLRVAPGEGKAINTGGLPIQQVVHDLPYHDASPGLMAVSQAVEERAARVGGTVEIAVGEGRQDAPVGTTLALLDQATKVTAAVHKGLHAAQAEEFQLLRDLFIEDPSPLFCGDNEWEHDQIVEALKNCNLVPASDPNTPSQMHRLIQAQAIKQVQLTNPQQYDAAKVDKRILQMVGVSDPESLFNTQPQQQGPDPMLALAEIKMKIEEGKAAAKRAELDFEKDKLDRELEMKRLTLQMQDRQKSADRASKEKIAALEAQTERLETVQSALIHAENIPAVKDYIDLPN